MVADRWLVFAILFVTRATIAYQFQSVASIGPLLVEAAAIDYATLGALIGSYMLPGVVLALPGGLLDQRFGAKRTIVLGLLLMAAGGSLMTGGTTTLMFAGRLVSGAGAAILNVVLARAVASRFEDRELALVMGAFVASWPLGIALALISLPVVALGLGWKAVMVTAALPSLACLAVFALVYRELPRGLTSRAGGLRLDLTTRDFRFACLAGLVWGLYNVTYVVLTSSLPEFFVDLGHSLTESAAIASIFGWVLIVSLPLGGYMGQRLGHPNLAMGACFGVIAVAAVALVLTEATQASLAVLVIAIGLPAGLIMAVPSQVLAVEQRSTGMGIFFTVFYIAMTTLPGLAGLLRERTGQVTAPILLCAATIVAAGIAVALLAWLRHQELRTAAPAGQVSSR